MDRGIIPPFDLLLKSPTIVKVLPEPVWPYAKIVPLYPFSADYNKLKNYHFFRIFITYIYNWFC